MKLLSSTEDRVAFHLGKREKQVLCAVLAAYPRIPPSHQVLSRGGHVPVQDAGQHLLDEALAEQRSQLQTQVQRFLSGEGLLRENETGWRLSLSRAEVEWLLQILNDVRVGSWVRLGSKDEPVESIDAQNAADVWAMHAALHFQGALLAALEPHEN